MRQPGCIGLLLFLMACGTSPPHPKTAEEQRTPPTQGTIHVGDFLATPDNCGLIHGDRPRYPTEARQAHVEGVVKFSVLITKTGEVADLHVVSGNPALVLAATEAVKQWRYAPCRVNGEPVEVKTRIDVSFTLSQ